MLECFFLDSLNGWAGGDSTNFLKTTNGGNNWIPISNLNNKYVYKILALNLNKIFAIGINTFLLSNNGGYNWNSVLETPTTCNDICFVNDMTGWASTFGTEMFLKSTNGGLNWFTIPPNMGWPFGRILFFNENTGWAVSGNSAYRTTNGGYNWLGSQITLYGPFNSIDFINIYTGWAVGEFGLIYKTTNGGLIPVSNISSEVPKSYALYQNYPNPFNPITKVKFEIPLSRGVSEGRGVLVRLIIYDILGREIAVLVNESLSPGTYEVTWDASNFPSGVYFYQLMADDFVETKKMVLIK